MAVGGGHGGLLHPKRLAFLALATVVGYILCLELYYGDFVARRQGGEAGGGNVATLEGFVTAAGSSLSTQLGGKTSAAMELEMIREREQEVASEDHDRDAQQHQQEEEEMEEDEHVQVLEEHEHDDGDDDDDDDDEDFMEAITEEAAPSDAASDEEIKDTVGKEAHPVKDSKAEPVLENAGAWLLPCR